MSKIVTLAVRRGTLLGVALASCATTAAPVGYTDRASFDAAVSNINASSTIVNFDDFTDDVTLPSGTDVDGIVFWYDFPGVELKVQGVTDETLFDTPSRPFFLVTDDAGVLQDGDDIEFQFDEPQHAFGLYITSADQLVDADVVLDAAGINVELDASAIEGGLTDGADVYFLGLVSATATFSSVFMTTLGDGVFLYSLDDIEIARAPDDDNDGAANAADNCLQRANPGQIDSDGDNIGNACDADIGQPNDCQVNVIDLGVLRAAFFGTPGSPNWNPDADFNSDNVVNVQDLGILRQLFFGTPGPSALPNPCAP